MHPLPPSIVILATGVYADVYANVYDSDDAKPSNSPLMVPMKPKITPSPSSGDESPLPQSPEPEFLGRKGRRRRHQGSLGDTVLINTLGNQNYPDVGVRAGKSPLNSDSEAGESMNMDDTGGGLKSLQTTAQNVLNVVAVKNEKDSNQSNVSKHDSVKRARPLRLETQRLVSRSREPSRVRSPSPSRVAARISNSVQASNPDSPETPQRTALPKLSEHTISQAEGSSKETLPAIQPAAAADPKSPANRQTLPSLEELKGNLIPSDEVTAQNIEMRPRSTFPLQSSPSGALLPRSAATFPSPQTRMNGFSNPTYTHNQPSPATNLSDGLSPRDVAFEMSPPVTRPNAPYFVQARTPANDQMTPMSAESFPSTGTPFSSEISPTGMEGRPILPPPPGHGSFIGAIFRCDHQDCNAAPFSTQYLLK